MREELIWYFVDRQQKHEYRFHALVPDLSSQISALNFLLAQFSNLLLA